MKPVNMYNWLLDRVCFLYRKKTANKNREKHRIKNIQQLWYFETYFFLSQDLCTPFENEQQGVYFVKGITDISGWA